MSARKTKPHLFGKGIILVIILSLLTLAAGVASIALLSQNTSVAHLFGGTDNVYESARLERMTINGYSVGDDLSAELKMNHAADADFDYYYDDVAFWGNGDKNTGIGFYTFSDTDGHIISSIKDVVIKYENRHLTTVEDFEETFGIGEHGKNENYETLTYHQGEYELSVQYKKDVIYNVLLLRHQ